MSASKATDFSPYEGRFYNSVYLKAPTLTTIASVVALLGGLALGLYGGSELIINGVSRDAFLYLGGGVMATGLASWCIHEIRRGNKSWQNVGPYRLIAHSSKGKHGTNQDAYFYVATDKGILFGVFDGHDRNGENVAKMGREEFPLLFEQNYVAGDIRQTLKNATAKLQEMACTFDRGGAVMAVGHIDVATKKLTTASLGDASILRFKKVGGAVVHNTVTEEENWEDMSEKLVEANRTQNTYKYGILHYPVAPDAPKPKPRLMIDEQETLNFTGSIGDNAPWYNLVLQREPDIQEDTLEAGELVGAFSDGIADFHLELDGVVKEHWGTRENLVKKMTVRARQIQDFDDCTGVMIFIPPVA